jgi:hypothetical protein
MLVGSMDNFKKEYFLLYCEFNRKIQELREVKEKNKQNYKCRTHFLRSQLTEEEYSMHTYYGRDVIETYEELDNLLKEVLNHKLYTSEIMREFYCVVKY